MQTNSTTNEDDHAYEGTYAQRARRFLAMTAARSLAAARAQQSTDQPRAGTAQMVSAEDLSDDPQKYYCRWSP